VRGSIARFARSLFWKLLWFPVTLPSRLVLNRLSLLTGALKAEDGPLLSLLLLHRSDGWAPPS
jgi:hypothetical protein